MINKFFYLFFLILLIPAGVMAIDQTIVHTNINVTYNYMNENISTLKILGEGLEWSQTFNKENWSGILEIEMIRELGNKTDITDIFDKLDVCLHQMNYTDQFEKCKQNNFNLTGRLYDCLEDGKFETNFTACIGNLSEKDRKISEKESEKNRLDSEWKERYDKLQKQKTWIMLGLLIAGGYVLYDIFIVKKGQISLKREERSSLPKEAAV